MTGQTASSTSAPPLSDDEVGRALAVLGMTASSELAAFSRLAADAALAPALAQRLELSGLAGTALRRLERLRARVRELDGDLETVMAPFSGVLVEFDGRTVPSTWWERLLKAYVGYGIADDFSRIAAGALDPVTREIVLEVLTDDGHAQLVVDSLAAAGEQDPALASRLALWGRRLVGEALGVVQRLLADHVEMRDLLDAAIPSVDGAEAQSRLFATLTAEHTRRMDRLGLTA